jgi:hypothetical protein
MAAAVMLGYWSISRGVVIEPPAFVSEAIAAFAARLAERVARVPGPTR